ncbi:hypothetical protein J4Q44_G00377790 [Coregonus suidteri]|uniref:Uncharacterized protein n=1 Tax=Coregonus suidteri TaxID=861788 RepID=A0AAN8Q532_9TELE
MPPPLHLLSPSHCLEINHELTARRQPSYGVLTVPSFPLLEKKWRWRRSLTLSSSTPLCAPGGERAGSTSAAVAEDLEQWRK